MKVSVLIIDEAKQIMLTPENDHERSALKMISPNDKIEAATKWGTMFDKEDRMAGYVVGKCQGGYYRGYPDEEAGIRPGVI